MIITGEVGQVRVGYQRAAMLRNWQLIPDEDVIGTKTSTVTAIVGSLDRYWSTQRPIHLALWMGGSWWVWDRAESSAELTLAAHATLVVHGDPIAVADFKGGMEWGATGS